MQTVLSDPRVYREHRCGVRGHPFLTFFGIAALIPITIVGIVQWRMVRQAETQAELTRDLLEKGLTVPEIERILQADMPHWERHNESPWAIEHAKIEANLKKELAHMGLTGDEIERVVKASGNALEAGRGKLSPTTLEKARKEASLKKEAGQQIQAARQADHEAAIRELIRRGWSQEEVERLLNSPPGTAGTSRSGSPTQ